jgi:adenylosuccinate synthase
MTEDAEQDTPLPRIVVLSGPVGSGKSTLAEQLVTQYGAAHIRTQELMKDEAAQRGDNLAENRRALQEYGDRLDQETDGQWVADGVGRMIADNEVTNTLIVVDAARILSQIDKLREAFLDRVTHIHLYAPKDELSERYEKRRDASHLQELDNYDQVAENKTEQNTVTLGKDADISIDSSRCSVEDVETRAVAALRLSSSRNDRLVDVLIGGQYGSEGKGNIAFFLGPEYDVLMRVGGPNAGHKVPVEGHYTHRLLPSGTLANPRATLLIGPGATLDLDVLLKEIADCGVEQGRLFIDPQAMIIEPADIEEEKRLTETIGSTGRGGGAAASRRIMGRSYTIDVPVRLAQNVRELQPYIRKAREVLEETFRAGGRVLLEGTQGTGLSIFHGHYPHVTSRDTTTAGTLAEAGIGPHRVRRIIVVIRTYPIRVGNPINGESGHMSQELDWADIAARSGHDAEELVALEKGSVSGTQRRVGEFDWVQLKQTSELNGATDIALTFSDYIDKKNQAARRFDQLTPDSVNFIEDVERVAGAPVTLIGTRFDRRSVIDRREW